MVGRMSRRALTAALVASAVASSPARAEGDLRTTRSPDTVAVTLDRLSAAVEAEGFKVFARANHPVAARRIGVTLRPVATLLFGKPQLGVPLIGCDPRLGFELPLRALVWQDASDQVWLGMVDPAALKARYHLGAACDAPLAALRAVEDQLLKGGTGTP